MSDLIIAAYRSRNAAFVAGERLAALQQAAGTEPEDIVVVTSDATGRVSVNQSIDLASGAPLGGGRWGALIGMMFLDRRKPVEGGVGLASQFLAAGLDSSFLQEVPALLETGGAAVGMRVRLLGAQRVTEALQKQAGTPRILQTRIGAEAEEALYDLQAQIPDRAVQPDDLI
ncbi:MAG: DUF1269 domain-containing protein [Tabrizicola sp.]|uniref:DUF1269 domain-containing protein n=1 Tax=Tabrizicola sp. TaxID=2005166 RepID=UPI002AB91A75|nr:DUF1269 domain-containing protein [Tabrizicola sp.]MDZ4085201.1 DUF1269 domain-containing protein [Tabrizicola sp.]